MGRDTETIDEETNGQKEIETKLITENQLINMKLDAIIELLTKKSE